MTVGGGGRARCLDRAVPGHPGRGPPLRRRRDPHQRHPGPRAGTLAGRRGHPHRRHPPRPAPDRPGTPGGDGGPPAGGRRDRQFGHRSPGPSPAPTAGSSTTPWPGRRPATGTRPGPGWACPPTPSWWPACRTSTGTKASSTWSRPSAGSTPAATWSLAGGPLYGAPSADYLGQVQAAAATSPARDRIHFAGLQDDVSWVYAAADVVAHCSVRPEPFGMAVVEALLSGTPVVASAAGTPGEMLDDGRTALLYPPGDVEALARCLARRAGRPRPGRLARGRGPGVGGRPLRPRPPRPRTSSTSTTSPGPAPSARGGWCSPPTSGPCREASPASSGRWSTASPAGIEWRCVTIVAGPAGGGRLPLPLRSPPCAGRSQARPLAAPG